MTVIRPGQRVVHIPGIGVRTSRRAVSAGGGVAYYYINYNATSTLINGGHGASLADLCLGNLTAEAWVYPTGWGETSSGGQIFSKYDSGYGAGWELTYRSSSSRYEAYVKTNVGYEGGSFQPAQTPDSTWHHVALTFTGAGTKRLSMFIDGVKSTDAIPAISGTPSADGATSNFIVGNLQDASRTYGGAIGWIRLSNTIRYTVDFTAPDRTVPPATDANTVLLYQLTEGSGTSIADSSGNGNTGTLSNGSWTAV